MQIVVMVGFKCLLLLTMIPMEASCISDAASLSPAAAPSAAAVGSRAASAAAPAPLQLPSALLSVVTADEEIAQNELPAARLPPPSREGWKLCDYSCMSNFNSSVRTSATGSAGVLEVDVQFRPLQNVTSDMMVWLFGNLHKAVAWLNGTKTTLVPMYQFFHPVDHVFHTSSTMGVRVGTNLTWCEMPLTGCQHQPLSADEPWSCPTNRTGFVRSDRVRQWSRLMHTKVTQTDTSFNSSSMEFVAKRSSPFFGGSGVRVVATTRHTWRDSPAGLLLRSQQWLGLMAASGTSTSTSTTTFETKAALLAASTNQIIQQAYLGGAANIPAGNITAAGYMAVLHYLQEYGGLPHWLPQVYAARQTVVPSLRAIIKPLDYHTIFNLAEEAEEDVVQRLIR